MQWSGVPGIYPNDDETNYYTAAVPAGFVTVNSSITVNSLNTTGSDLNVASSALLTTEAIPIITNGQTTGYLGGDLNVANSSLQVDGNITVQGAFNLNGSLTGAGTINLNSNQSIEGTQFDWTGGQISGTGQLNLSSVGAMTIDTSSTSLSFGGWTIFADAFPGLIWTGDNDVISTGGGTITTQGSFELLADQTFGVPAAPGVAPITISLGIIGGIVKDSPGTTRLENVIINSSDPFGLLSPVGVTVSQGTLILDNPLSVSKVNVDGILQAPSISASQISGHGTIQSSVTTDSVIFPSPQTIILGGSPISIMTPFLPLVVGPLHINGNCTLGSRFISVSGNAGYDETTMNFNVLGPDSGQHDEVDITGTLALESSSAPLVFFIGLDFVNYLPQVGDTFDLVTFSSLQNFTMPLVDCVGVAPGFEFSITPTANALVFTALNDAEPVPEPCALMILPTVLLLRRRIK